MFMYNAILYSRVWDTKHQFFQRQFAMAVKLLRNLLSWQGLLGDMQLKNLALGSLLNRYLLAGLRVSAPTEALCKANMVCYLILTLIISYFCIYIEKYI